MQVEMKRLEAVGYRCCECGRLDANSNQPCTEHGDVEVVYRVADGPVEGHLRMLAVPLAAWGSEAVLSTGPDGRKVVFYLREDEYQALKTPRD